MPGAATVSDLDYKAIYSEYEKNGCLKIENFLTLDEVNEMKQELEKIIDNIPEEKTHVFSAYEPSDGKETDEYYINSSDKIRFFYEKDAFDENGKLLVDKKDALNKIAYALHWWNPVFKKYTFNPKIKDLLHSFEYKDPVVVQSMLIFKKPKIGEVFRPHQDSTFLYTEPPTCIGLWMPLEDATEENGCLWFVPGSHKHGVHQRFLRNPKLEPRFIIDGKIPDYKDEEYVPVPAKKGDEMATLCIRSKRSDKPLMVVIRKYNLTPITGDCVLIHGSVVHKSGVNNTDKARTVWTFHAVEKEAPWSEANWVQQTEVLPFPSIYSN